MSEYTYKDEDGDVLDVWPITDSAVGLSINGNETVIVRWEDGGDLFKGLAAVVATKGGDEEWDPRRDGTALEWVRSDDPWPRTITKREARRLHLNAWQSGANWAVANPEDAAERAPQSVPLSLGSVVEPKGGESGASVPAPAVPMEGEPGPGVQLGPARASMDDAELDSMLQAIVMEVSSSRYNSLYGGGFEDSDEELQEQLDSLRAVARQFIGEPITPSRWLPPNASDTHATAPRLACASCGARGTLQVDDDDRLWCEDHKGMARF